MRWSGGVEYVIPGESWSVDRGAWIVDHVSWIVRSKPRSAE